MWWMAADGRRPVGPALPLVLAVPGHGELVVRPMRVDDVDGLVGLYAGLGAADRRRRFFSQFTARRAWVEDWIARCTARGVGLVAEHAPTGRVVGEAAYVLQPNGDGEFSLTVDAEWRGWLGPFLLDVLVDAAAAHGVPNLEAEILTDNRAMLSIVRRRGAATAGDSDASVVHVVIGTASRQPGWPPRRRAGTSARVLVEAPGTPWGPGAAAERAGSEVLGCAGPERRGSPCPALDGEPCPLAAGADVIVVALPPSSEVADALVAAHGRVHPGVPVVVVGDAGSAADVACRLEAGAPSARLLEAIARLSLPQTADRAPDDAAGPS